MSVNLGAGFEGWLREKLPNAKNLKLADIQVPSSGMSAETRLFSIDYEDPRPKSERLVLRCGPRGAGIFPDYDLGFQVGVMRSLYPTQVPVPRVRWYEADDSIIGSPFVVMEHIEGTVPSDTAPGFHGQGLFFQAAVDERAAMWRSGIEQMALLHSLDWRSLGLPPLPCAADNAAATMRGQIDLLQGWMDWGDMHAIAPIQQGMKWLRDTELPTQRTSLVWGDARPGNIIYRDGEPVALLDWEIASIGLPEFDLFYWWWSSEMLAEVNHVERLPGLPGKEETIAMYEAAAGRSIADVADYAEKFAVLRLAIMNVLGIKAAVSDAYTHELLLDNCAIKALQARLD